MEIFLFIIYSILYGIIVTLFGAISCILFYFLIPFLWRFFDAVSDDIEDQLIGRI